MEDIYVRLRDKIEQFGIGYPATESGAEFTMLKTFFSQDNAEYYVDLIDAYETPEEYASRTGKNSGSSAERLEDMAKRGLIFRLRKEDKVQYRPVPIVHGLFEFNVENLSPSWVPDFFAHLGTGLGKRVLSTDTPFLRTVPMSTDVVAGSQILPLDNAAEIIKKQTVIVLARCECRAIGAMFGNPCTHPVESCLLLGDFAEFYLENKWGRRVTTDEALQILKSGVESGRIPQMLNSKNAECICTCCTCHCGDLKVLEMCGHDDIGRKFLNNYVCRRDEAVCTEACSEICIKACPTGAHMIVEGAMKLKEKRCLGCGQCVSKCPTGALALHVKPAEQIYEPVDSVFEGYTRQAAYRKAHGLMESGN
jgi:Fe-S-cluster-containing hydrogenase component 2